MLRCCTQGTQQRRSYSREGIKLYRMTILCDVSSDIPSKPSVQSCTIWAHINPPELRMYPRVPNSFQTCLVFHHGRLTQAPVGRASWHSVFKKRALSILENHERRKPRRGAGLGDPRSRATCITQHSNAQSLLPEQERRSAGPCAHLSDLPLHLLYNIAQSLDLRSQRNLFLSSSQLYSKWQLHIPDDVHRQFVRKCINVMEKASAGGQCDSALLSINFSAISSWKITCHEHQQSTQPRAKHDTN